MVARMTQEVEVEVEEVMGMGHYDRLMAYYSTKTRVKEMIRDLRNPLIQERRKSKEKEEEKRSNERGKN